MYLSFVSVDLEKNEFVTFILFMYTKISNFTHGFTRGFTES